MASWARVVEPGVEPVSVAEAKAQCRLEPESSEGVILGAEITAARALIEEELSRALINQTWDLYLDEFPSGDSLELPRPPLVSVTGVYYTPDGAAESTFGTASYLVDAHHLPGRLVLQRDASWPSDTLQAVNGVRVRLVAGYGTAGTCVPMPLRQACLLLTGHLYENREATVAGAAALTEIPLGVDRLLWPFRWSLVG